jgi:hypothetical protein
MAWSPNYKLGVDAPVWDWLSMFPGGNSNPGTANTYDGVRYMYWVVQTGTTATSASTTLLYRFDTWTDAWQYLANTTSGNNGMDIEYDSVRNVLYIIHGVALTSWQVFNLNTTSVTISNTVCAAWALTTMAPVLPAAANPASSITMTNDLDVAVQIDSGTLTSGSTSTVLNDTVGVSFGTGMVGLQVRLTSGTYSAQSRTIVSVQSASQLTVAPAFGGAPGLDTYVVEQQQDTATSGAVGTLTDTKQAWATNQYRNMDVVILSGTGSGQRRRIASNTATVLTLAGTVTGNVRTGNFGVAPDATSVYKIVPSSDFLYFQPGTTSAVLYKIDVATGANAATWTTLTSAPATPGGGANTFFAQSYAPYSIIMLRGGATATYYQYSIGLETWATPTVFAGSETFTTGASAAMLHGKRRLAVQKEGSTRLYALNLTTGIYEPLGTMPYANPSANDGKRGRFVKTADGVEWFYLMRAGGAEFFRVALEWLADV